MKLKNINVKPQIPENLKKLFKLAYNLWSTWNKEAVQLFRRIDSKMFYELNNNPIKLLHKIEQSRLNQLSKDKGFLYELEKVWEKFELYMDFKGFYVDENDEKQYFQEDDLIAYFSMEFGIHESLPIYSGGLGVLAGDYLKAVSDMGVPLVGFGLLYTYGYLTQFINIENYQEEEYIENNWFFKPIMEVKNENGKPLIFNMKIKNMDVAVKLWKLQVGKTNIYLLDTDIDKNDKYQRSITDYLYNADRTKRLEQEILLGEGSVKALEILNLKPRIYHLNEGHSAFLIIERLKNLINNKGFDFTVARQIIRNSTLFTTHTPVIEGNENFKLELIKEYLKNDIEKIGIIYEDFIKFGEINNSKKFWMPAFAIKFSRFSNGVSRLHRKISKQMWSNLFPEFHDDEIPIDHVTNGVHLQSWLSPELTTLFDNYIGPEYLHRDKKQFLWDKIYEIADGDIWDAHKKSKRNMVNFVRKRLNESYKRKGLSSAKIEKISNILNPDYLTIGFARRFATYKRANLILQDKERLKNILKNSKKPVQIIFSGKAHPADKHGKEIIREILNYAEEYELEKHIVFLENYDINIARYLVQGVDVWLNNPIKPKEASGTSGMKAGINGILNLSVLDGWWPECYNKENGWAITAGERYDKGDVKDGAEANQIYDLLEEEITELYYDRGQKDYSQKWVKLMKNSISTVCKSFNMHTMLSSYLNKFYLLEISKVKKLENNNYEELKKVKGNIEEIKKCWNDVVIESVESDINKKNIFAGQTINNKVIIDSGRINRELLCIELFYKYNESHEVIPLKISEQKEENNIVYTGSFKIKGSGVQGINIRVRPSDDMIFLSYPEYIKWYF